MHSLWAGQFESPCAPEDCHQKLPPETAEFSTGPVRWMFEDQIRTWDALLRLPTQRQSGAPVWAAGWPTFTRPVTRAPGLWDKSAIAGGLAGDSWWTLEMARSSPSESPALPMRGARA